jgi:hypothetical protein
MTHTIPPLPILSASSHAPTNHTSVPWKPSDRQRCCNKICNRNNIVLLGKTNKVEEQIRPSVTLRWRVSVGLSECPSLGSRRTPYNSGIGYEASQARRHLPQKRLSTVVGPIVRTLERRLRQINCNDSPQKKAPLGRLSRLQNQRRNKETGCIW